MEKELTWNMLKTLPKTNQVGFVQEKSKPKRVVQHENTEDPSRCPVRLYKLYLSHCSTDSKAFYLKPLTKPNGDLWYSSYPVGTQQAEHNGARHVSSCWNHRLQD